MLCDVCLCVIYWWCIYITTNVQRHWFRAVLCPNARMHTQSPWYCLRTFRQASGKFDKNHSIYAISGAFPLPSLSRTSQAGKKSLSNQCLLTSTWVPYTRFISYFVFLFSFHSFFCHKIHWLRKILDMAKYQPAIHFFIHSFDVGNFLFHQIRFTLQRFTRFRLSNHIHETF